MEEFKNQAMNGSVVMMPPSQTPESNRYMQEELRFLNEKYSQALTELEEKEKL